MKPPLRADLSYVLRMGAACGAGVSVVGLTLPPLQLVAGITLGISMVIYVISLYVAGYRIRLRRRNG